ncbi:MAG: DNA adenine methylase, partial [Pseudomonadota bacterium]|nr:DNA adenine methylase [Pseudomonadota bacterium]
ITWQKHAQELCGNDDNNVSGVVWRAYGGHYFSPTQAITFDAMLQTLPQNDVERTVCLAATIIAASSCAASPGHTAQPFKATGNAGLYLREAWERDPIHFVKRALVTICSLCAKAKGATIVEDANSLAKRLNSEDLVFVDPPYSGVHYSRFYHVLETIARGGCGSVEGVGRYPPPHERPKSLYSIKSTAFQAIEDLLKSLSENGCKVIFTFPDEHCSNGLSGRGIEEVANKYFRISKRSIKTRFSTLGGNTLNRDARKVSDELMLLLNPS